MQTLTINGVQTTCTFQRRLIEVEVPSILTLVCTSDSFNLSQQFPIACHGSSCVCVSVCVISLASFGKIFAQNEKNFWEIIERKNEHTHTPTEEKYKRRSNLYIIKKELFLCSVMHAKCENEHEQRQTREREWAMSIDVYAWNGIRQSQLIDSCLLCLAKCECAFGFDVSVCARYALCMFSTSQKANKTNGRKSQRKLLPF